MNRLLCVCSLLLGICAGQNSWIERERLAEKFYKGNVQGLLGLLSGPQMPQRYLTGHETFHNDLKEGGGVLGFSWHNCGSLSDPVLIKSMSVSPDPIQVPGDIQVGFEVSFAQNVTAFELDVILKKKVGFWWVEVPCIEGKEGSCNYGNACAQQTQTCPDPFQQYAIPCTCPFPVGDYILPVTTFPIPTLPLPSWLTSGDYWARMTAYDGASRNRLFCYEISLSMD